MLMDSKHFRALGSGRSGYSQTPESGNLSLNSPKELFFSLAGVTYYCNKFPVPARGYYGEKPVYFKEEQSLLYPYIPVLITFCGLPTCFSSGCQAADRGLSCLSPHPCLISAKQGDCTSAPHASICRSDFTQ